MQNRMIDQLNQININQLKNHTRRKTKDPVLENRLKVLTQECSWADQLHIGWLRETNGKKINLLMGGKQKENTQPLGYWVNRKIKNLSKFPGI